MKYKNHLIKKSINKELNQILKGIEKLLCEKINIDDYCFKNDEHNFIVNDDSHNYLIKIKPLSDNRNGYNILIATKYEGNIPIKYANYELINGIIQKKNSNYYYKSNDLLVTIDNDVFGISNKIYSTVTLTKGKIVCKIHITENNQEILFDILKISNLDLKNVYNSLKVSDITLISDIRIEIFNQETQEINIILIENGMLNYYEKKCQINGKRIVIIYENEKIIVSAGYETIDKKELEIINMEANEELEKIKKNIK